MERNRISNYISISPKEKILVAMGDYYSELLIQARRRDLSDKEIALVVAELQKANPEADPYILLSILCYSYDEQYIPLIERYLHGPDDYLASEALWVLCSCWDLSPKYVHEMLAFMEGVPRDEYEDRKRIAVSCAGTHLKRYSAPKLLRKIINVLEDENETESVRETAYQELYIITGGDLKKLPFSSKKFDPKTAIDPAVIKLAKERLAREEGWEK